MTRNEFDILTRLKPPPLELARWMRPRDFGGGDNTHHGRTADRMSAKAHRGGCWVEKRQAGGGEKRPTWEYRITRAGMIAQENAALTFAIGR